MNNVMGKLQGRGISVSFRRIATVEQLQLEQTDRHTHTHSQLTVASIPGPLNAAWNRG